MRPGMPIGISWKPLADATRDIDSTLRLVDSSNRFHRVRFVDALVVAIALHACQSQRETAGVARACLQIAERNLHHELRADIHGPLVAADLSRQKLPRLPLEHCIRQPLEG